MSGAILAFARGMGEFGITLMLAGSIPGRTQTLPLAIYDAVQSNDLAQANALATQRIINARPMWEDIPLRADGVWPDMKGTRLLLHAGPPVKWADMCGPMHGAMIGAVLYEGWADTPEKARQMLAAGEVEFAQCHDFDSVGPMTGIISASMPLIKVREASNGNIAYTNINEGIGRCLRSQIRCQEDQSQRGRAGHLHW